MSTDQPEVFKLNKRLGAEKRHWQAELVSSSPVRWRLSGFYVSIKKSIVCHYLILNNKENIQTPRHTTTSPLKFHPTICPCQLNPPSILGNSGVATKRKPGWVPATDAPLKIAWLPSLQKKMGKRFVSCHRFDWPMIAVLYSWWLTHLEQE